MAARLLTLFALMVSTVASQAAAVRPDWQQTLRHALLPLTLQIEELQPDGIGQVSPNGKWMAQIVEYAPPPGVEGNAYPSGLRLYDETGKFVRELTKGRFYRVASFQWSQTGNALFIRTQSDYAYPGTGGVWKIELDRPDTIFRPDLEWLPGPEDETLALPVFSPAGDSYLVDEHWRLQSSIYLVRPNSSIPVARLASGSDPQWSPDGREILYTKWPVPPGMSSDGQWTMRADGRHDRPLLTQSALKRAGAQHGWTDIRHPWAKILVTPAGRLLAVGVDAIFGDAKVRSNGILLVDRRGRVRHAIPNLMLLSSSGDGRRLYVCEVRPEDARRTRYFRIDLNR